VRQTGLFTLLHNRFEATVFGERCGCFQERFIFFYKLLFWHEIEIDFGKIFQPFLLFFGSLIQNKRLSKPA